MAQSRRTRGKPKKQAKAEATPASRRSRFMPTSSAKMPRFAGVPSFLRLPVLDPTEAISSVDVLLLGVPFDGGTSFRPGARFAPRAVRDASSLSRRFSAALGIDIYDELRVADGGDIALAPDDIDMALEAIAERAETIARSGVIGGFVGGDQTVTLGALRGIHRAKLRPITFIHIDAHSNSSGPAWNREVHQGSVVRNAVDEELIRPDATIQVGIRGPYSTADDLAFALSHGFEIVNVDEVKWDLHSVVSQVRKVARAGAVYVSVDATAIDPAYAPGVGIPSPGGMSSWELQQILRALVGADIVGFDVVEIAPAYDQSGITALLGVAIVQEILSAIADTRRSARPAPSTHRGDSRRGRRLSP
jgi:agmatinase